MHSKYTQIIWVNRSITAFDQTQSELGEPCTVGASEWFYSVEDYRVHTSPLHWLY